MNTTTETVAVAPPRTRQRKLARQLDGAARQLLEERGTVGQWSPQFCADVRRWVRETAPTLGAGASLKTHTRDTGSTKLKHNLQSDAVRNEYRQAVMYAAAHTRGSCPWSTAGCRLSCLVESGQLALSAGQAATKARRDLMDIDPPMFVAAAALDVRATAKAYKRETPGAQFVYRFNGTTEVALETAPALVELIASAADDAGNSLWLMDYAKRPIRGGWHTVAGVPYFIAPSVSERHTTPEDVPDCGVIVFDRLAHSSGPDEELPPHMPDGRVIVDGDKHDLRLADADQLPPGTRYVVGLRVKGNKARAMVRKHRANPSADTISWSTFIKPADTLELA